MLCVQCGLTAVGHHDPSDGAFYCEQCWREFYDGNDDDDENGFIAEAPTPVPLAAFVVSSRPLVPRTAPAAASTVLLPHKTGKHEEAMTHVRYQLLTLGITLPPTYSLTAMEGVLRGHQFLVAEFPNTVYTFQWPLLTIGGVSYEIPMYYPEDLPTIAAVDPKHGPAVRYVSSRLAVLRHRQIVSLTYAVIQRLSSSDDHLDGYTTFNEIFDRLGNQVYRSLPILPIGGGATIFGPKKKKEIPPPPKPKFKNWYTRPKKV